MSKEDIKTGILVGIGIIVTINVLSFLLTVLVTY
jgi:hypothetical protein